MGMIEMKKWVLDVRFIINAEKDYEASQILEEFLPETNEQVYTYGPIGPTTLFEDELLKRLKEDISNHFSNETELIRRYQELSPHLSKEQQEELLEMTYGHPHTKFAAQMFQSPKTLEELAEIMSRITGKKVRIEIDEPDV